MFLRKAPSASCRVATTLCCKNWGTRQHVFSDMAQVCSLPSQKDALTDKPNLQSPEPVLHFAS